MPAHIQMKNHSQPMTEQPAIVYYSSHASTAWLILYLNEYLLNSYFLVSYRLAVTMSAEIYIHIMQAARQSTMHDHHAAEPTSHMQSVFMKKRMRLTSRM
jgi:hypothetical protein